MISLKLTSHPWYVLHRSVHCVAMLSQTHYELLGVPECASREEIRRAFFTLSKKHHPDVSRRKDATRKFSEINEAYSVLTDPAKRYQYDMTLYSIKSSANYSGATTGRHTPPTASSPYGGFHSNAHSYTGAYSNVSEKEWAELHRNTVPRDKHYRVIKWLIAIMLMGSVVHTLRISAAHRQFKKKSDESDKRNNDAYSLVRERARNSTVQEQLERLSQRHTETMRQAPPEDSGRN